MKIKSVGVLIALFATSSVALADDGFYVGAKLLGARRQVSDMTLTSPRVTNRINTPDAVNRLNGSIAAGYTFAEEYRAELEYTLPSTGNYVARWNPFINNDNVLQTRSSRLMVNAYRDWSITEKTSFYVMVGAGGTLVRAKGWQTTPDRTLDSRWTYRPTYSAGIGLSHQLPAGVALDAGYRFVRAGQFSTGRNAYANAAMARDEQLQGRLREHNVYVGLRKSF